MTYRVQVYGGDVGISGGDVDFDEVESLEEARRVAAREHPRGARPSEIYDEETETLVEEYDRCGGDAARVVALHASKPDLEYPFSDVVVY